MLACSPALALDSVAAQALARQSGCLKCHAPAKKKDGPSFQEIARKHKGKAGYEQKMIERLIKGDKVKIDGVEEDHLPIKTKDRSEVRNIVQWVLSH